MQGSALCRWFCVLKKDGITLRIVHSLKLLNKITIKYSGIPPIPDHMGEQFAGCTCGASLNLYVGYDEHLILFIFKNEKETPPTHTRHVGQG